MVPPSLHHHIDALYSAFAVEACPRAIEGCRCCVGDAEVRRLLTTPLREIPQELMSRYAGSVFLTVGSEEDFRYFLPRILELNLTMPGWWLDIEIIGRAIGTHGWDGFTEPQQAALAALVHERMAQILTKMVDAPDRWDGDNLDAWLCFASHFLPSWSDLLREIEEAPTALLALYEQHSRSLSHDAVANGFWKDSPRHAEYLAWFLRLQDDGTVNQLYGL